MGMSIYITPWEAAKMRGNADYGLYKARNVDRREIPASWSLWTAIVAQSKAEECRGISTNHQTWFSCFETPRWPCFGGGYWPG